MKAACWDAKRAGKKAACLAFQKAERRACPKVDWKVARRVVTWADLWETP